MFPNSQLSHVAGGGREPAGQGGTATWKRLDGNHLAWLECGLQGGEEQEPGDRPWWAGGWRVGAGSGRPGGPYLPDCCSPDAFTATAWPIQPADLIPSSPPLQAPLCLPRRLKALLPLLLGVGWGEGTGHRHPEPRALPGQADLGGSSCMPCTSKLLWASVSPPQRGSEGSWSG